ncbi:MAG TPA: SGNH/GDSL hydrolase family protein [Trebonia sp.]|jgi:hypothetical protein|nr:SGNH/GDSL hydrolase family protein [Trebonia sp.]
MRLGRKGAAAVARTAPAGAAVAGAVAVITLLAVAGCSAAGAGSTAEPTALAARLATPGTRLAAPGAPGDNGSGSAPAAAASTAVSSPSAPPPSSASSTPAGTPPAASSAAAPPAAPSGPATPPAPGAAITSLTGPIVALGDSYTAGDLMPLAGGSAPFGCLRSANAYPRQVAAALHDASGLVNASCSGAVVADMTASQSTTGGKNPPQMGSLSAGDALVVLTLGGDDLGFWNVLNECVKLSWSAPFSNPCQRHYAGGGTDQLASRIAALGPKMSATLAAIHSRAPGARVVLAGYPDLFPQHGGCWPGVPITSGDITYLRGLEVKLNSVLAAAAGATGTTFADTYDATIGHDFCSSAATRDVEGLLPGSLTVPFHPNARGQAAIAATVLAALRS